MPTRHLEDGRIGRADVTKQRCRSKGSSNGRFAPEAEESRAIFEGKLVASGRSVINRSRRAAQLAEVHAGMPIFFAVSTDSLRPSADSCCPYAIASFASCAHCVTAVCAWPATCASTDAY